MTAKTIYYTALGGASAVGAVIANSLGGWDTGLQTLVILMAVDYVTGVLCALVWKKSPKSTNEPIISRCAARVPSVIYTSSNAARYGRNKTVGPI